MISLIIAEEKKLMQTNTENGKRKTEVDCRFPFYAQTNTKKKRK